MKVRNDDGVSLGMSKTSKPIQAGKVESGSQATSPRPTTEDRVELSDRARALHVANDSLKTSESIRADKVEYLKQTLNNGTYHVPGVKIAERMLGEGLFA